MARNHRTKHIFTASFPKENETTKRLAEEGMRPGARVKLSARYLVFTGQAVGKEGTRTWILRPCGCGLCRSGSFVCTDEEINEGQYRHIAKANLIVVGGPVTLRNEAP